MFRVRFSNESPRARVIRHEEALVLGRLAGISSFYIRSNGENLEKLAFVLFDPLNEVDGRLLKSNESSRSILI